MQFLLFPFTVERQIDFKDPIQVPYKWSRVVVENTCFSNSVYYVSPSGHVITSIQDVIDYLENPSTCKCFLDHNLELNQVFSFDPNIDTIQTLEWHGQTTFLSCISWDNTLTARERYICRLQSLDYIMSHLVHDVSKVYKVLHNVSHTSSDDFHFKQWMRFFDWEKIQLLDGNLMSMFHSQIELMHLSYELASSRKLDFFSKNIKVIFLIVYY